MKINLALLIVLLFKTGISFGQQMNCAQAAQQLQMYAVQVNQIYQNEYWSIIPNQRCPAVNAFGMPFNPVMVQNCRMQMLAMLNNWYAQQCDYVNGWYYTIANTCSGAGLGSRPAPNVDPAGTGEEYEIDTEEIENLKVAVNDEKMVKIKIPKTALGFKGN
jgi:hypothetical protein